MIRRSSGCRRRRLAGRDSPHVPDTILSRSAPIRSKAAPKRARRELRRVEDRGGGGPPAGSPADAAFLMFLVFRPLRGERHGVDQLYNCELEIAEPHTQ